MSITGGIAGAMQIVLERLRPKQRVHWKVYVTTKGVEKMRLTGKPLGENGGIDFSKSPSQRPNPPRTPEQGPGLSTNDDDFTFDPKAGGNGQQKSGLALAMERHNVAQETTQDHGEAPSTASLQVAAGLWTFPQHGQKEMDGEFARSIAFALDAVKADASKDFTRYKISAEALLNRVHDRLQSQDAELRSMRGRLEVFETMKQLFEAGRRNDTYGMEASLEWMIREFIAHGPRNEDIGRAV